MNKINKNLPKLSEAKQTKFVGEVISWSFKEKHQDKESELKQILNKYFKY